MFHFNVCSEILVVDIWHISGSHWARSSLKQRSKEKALQARWSSHEVLLMIDNLQLNLICLDCYVQVNKLMDETERQLQAIAVLAENH